MNILIDAACQVPSYLMPSITRLASRMRRTGVAPIATPGGTLYLHRRPSGLFHVTTDAEPGAYETKQADYSWSAQLWAELEAGAETPEERLELATGMVPRLPCGECRIHWRKALVDTPPPVETAEAFHYWVWERRMEIARRKNRPQWAYPGYAHEKK